MRACCCSLAGTLACKYCSNGSYNQWNDYGYMYNVKWDNIKDLDGFFKKGSRTYTLTKLDDMEDCCMDKIVLKDTSKGDSRTSGGSPSLEDIWSATRTHQKEVAEAMDFIADKLKKMGEVHDWTKTENFEKEYGWLVNNNVKDEDFLVSDWWWRHLTLERHHVKDYAHVDVNLLDVLEFIVDRVCAEKGRSGSINMNYLELDPIVLVRAYYNTIKLLDDVTVRE